MGAETLFKTLDGKLNAAQVKAHIEDHIQNEKRANSSSRDYEGYSGNWGELSVHCKTHSEIIDSEDLAHDFLDRITEKWGGAEAVRYKASPRLSREETLKFQEDKKEAFGAHKKLVKAEEQFQVTLDKFEKASKEAAEIKNEMNTMHSVKESPFHKCHECKSSIAGKYVTKPSETVTWMQINEARRYKTIEEFLARYQSSSVPSCPLCKTVMLGETIKKRLIKKLETVFELCAETNATSEKVISLRKEIEESLLKKLKKEDELIWLVCGVAAS